MKREYEICRANISEDGVYRYSLERFWGKGSDFRTMVFCMLNPSTADAEKDDPTIRRCIGFAEREGRNKILVVNTLALRTYNPDLLYTHSNPMGPFNRFEIKKACREAASHDNRIICAWGNNCPRHVAQATYELILGMECVPYCLGTTKKGEPKHPLYLAGDTPFVKYERK